MCLICSCSVRVSEVLLIPRASYLFDSFCFYQALFEFQFYINIPTIFPSIRRGQISNVATENVLNNRLKKCYGILILVAQMYICVQNATFNYGGLEESCVM